MLMDVMTDMISPVFVCVHHDANCFLQFELKVKDQKCFCRLLT